MAGKLPVNQQVPMLQVIEVDLRTIQHHLPNEQKQEVTHLTTVVSDDDEFADDPHQVLPTEDVFTVPAIPRENLKGFYEGYLLPAEVTALRNLLP